MTFALPPAPGSPAGAPPRYVRCAALPFGWSASPLIFTKVMRVMVRMLRSPMAPTLERARRRTASGRAVVLRLHRAGRVAGPRSIGMRCLPYVDDFLLLGRTRDEALACKARAEEVMRMLGIRRHPTKGWWDEPTQRLEHLGLDVDTEAGLFRVPPAKLAKLMGQARDIAGLAAREARLVPVRLLAGFVGYAQSVYLACPSARLMTGSARVPMKPLSANSKSCRSFIGRVWAKAFCRSTVIGEAGSPAMATPAANSVASAVAANIPLRISPLLFETL